MRLMCDPKPGSSRLGLPILAAAVLGLLTPTSARAQGGPKVDVERLAAQLVGEDYRRAVNAEGDLSLASPAPAIAAILRERRRVQKLDIRARCDRVVDALLEGLIDDIMRPLSDRGYGAIIGLGGGTGAAMGHLIAASARAEDEVEEMSPEQRRARARAAREALVAIGPEVTFYLLRTPPGQALRSPEKRQALYQVSQRIAGAATDGGAALEAARGNLDLLGFAIAVGMRDERPAVRAAYQAFRDAALTAELARLDSEDYAERAAAEETLFRLAGLAKARVEHWAKSAPKDGHGRLAAERLGRRIRFRVSARLYEKMSRSFEGYDALDFRGRRSLVLEVERLGGVDGVPTLRAIMALEKSATVRLLAAVSLARLGDPVGLYRLQREGLAESLTIPLSDRLAIYLDQGIRYLNIKRFDRAEREFLRVLKLDPKNELALYNLACTYSLWGKIEKAFEFLKRTIDAGYDDLSHIESDPDLDPLRNEARYKELIEPIRRKKARADSRQ